MQIVDGIPLLKNLNDESIKGMYDETVKRSSSDNCIFMIYKKENDQYIYFNCEGLLKEHQDRLAGSN